MQSNRRLGLLVLLIGLAAMPGAGQGQEKVYTVGDLAKVQSQTIFYEAKAREAAAKQKVLENGGRVEGAYLFNQQGQRRVTGTPVLNGVVGRGAALHATLSYQNGAIFTVKKGDTLPDGQKVTLISIDRVVLEKAGHKMELLYSGAKAALSRPEKPLPGQQGQR